jgi:hypothetical protein
LRHDPSPLDRAVGRAVDVSRREVPESRRLMYLAKEFRTWWKLLENAGVVDRLAWNSAAEFRNRDQLAQSLLGVFVSQVLNRGGRVGIHDVPAIWDEAKQRGFFPPTSDDPNGRMLSIEAHVRGWYPPEQNAG